LAFPFIPTINLRDNEHYPVSRQGLPMRDLRSSIGVLIFTTPVFLPCSGAQLRLDKRHFWRKLNGWKNWRRLSAWAGPVQTPYKNEKWSKQTMGSAAECAHVDWGFRSHLRITCTNWPQPPPKHFSPRLGPFFGTPQSN
jgi:hypothetical protein